MTSAQGLETGALAAFVLVVCATLTVALRMRHTVTGLTWLPGRLSPGTTGSPGSNLPTGADSWMTWSRQLLRPRRRLVAFVWWLTVLITLLDLTAPWPVKVLVDNILGSTPAQGLLAPVTQLPAPVAALVVGAAGLVAVGFAALMSYLVTVLTTALEEDVTCRLRDVVLTRLLTASPPAVAQQSPGELGMVYSSDRHEWHRPVWQRPRCLSPRGCCWSAC